MLCAVDKRFLKKQIGAGISRNAQLGKNYNICVLVYINIFNYLLRVKLRIADLDIGNGTRQSDKIEHS